MSPHFTRQEIIEATGARESGAAVAAVDGVSTDTRKVAPGQLFVALKGETFDGHDFVAQAAKSGAAAALVAKGAKVEAPAGFPLFEVDDTLVALGLLARHYRRRFSMPLGAITGSNGKTTTKEMIGAILATRGPALKTEGNLNNEVGVPLMLLRLESSHAGAIIEMGMNHPGELRRLSSYAEPKCAAVISVAPAHLEGMGTIEAVADAKAEIYSGLPRDGKVIANADSALIMDRARASGRPLMTFGRAEKADVRLGEIVSHDARGLQARILFEGRSHPVRLSFLGEHNAVNACAAFAMGIALGCTPEQCVAGLEAARPWAHRLSLSEAPGGVSVIDDCYNANPASMSAALATLREVAKGRRTVAVLGDMLELGAQELALHRALGEEAIRSGVQVLVAFGPRSRETFAAATGALRGEAFHQADTTQVAGAVDFLKGHLRAGDVVLVKGSRGMKLERVVDALTGQKGGGH